MQTGVIIAGQGIAGLTLSCLLEQKGIEHRVLTRRGKANHFALGETLPPSALPLLKQAGLLEMFENTAVQKTNGYHSLWGTTKVRDENFYFHRPYQYGLKTDKQVVINHLVAKQAKHIFTYDKNLSVQRDDKRIAVTVGQEGRAIDITGQLIVDATGRKRSVLGQLNIPTIEYDQLIAYSCHLPRVNHPALVHPVYTEAFEQGWGIVSALNEEQNVMTLFTNSRSGIDMQARQYEHWASLLAHTVNLKDFLAPAYGMRVKGAQASSSRPQEMAGTNWLAIGDAALAFDPVSSHGITNAVYTAWKAADAIQACMKREPGALKEYDISLSAIFKQYLQTRQQVYRSERRWLQSPFWKAMQAKPVMPAGMVE